MQHYPAFRLRFGLFFLYCFIVNFTVLSLGLNYRNEIPVIVIEHFVLLSKCPIYAKTSMALYRRKAAHPAKNKCLHRLGTPVISTFACRKICVLCCVTRIKHYLVSRFVWMCLKDNDCCWYRHAACQIFFFAYQHFLWTCILINFWTFCTN